jgi:hypothetical protein
LGPGVPIAPVSECGHCFPGDGGHPREGLHSCKWYFISPGNREIMKRTKFKTKNNKKTKHNLPTGGPVLKHQVLFCLNQDIWSLCFSRTKSPFSPRPGFYVFNLFQKKGVLITSASYHITVYIRRMPLSLLPSD